MKMFGKFLGWLTGANQMGWMLFFYTMYAYYFGADKPSDEMTMGMLIVVYLLWAEASAKARHEALLKEVRHGR